MTGPLAQVIALTAYGNYFLKRGGRSNFRSDNSTLQFCNKVEFIKFTKRFFSSQPKESVVAASPGEWFDFLKEDNCTELRLYFEHSKDQSFAKDHKLAGMVGGGGTWLIEAVYERYSNYWANRWEVTREDDPEQRIWTVTYGLTAENQVTSNLQIDLSTARENLEKILTDIADFAFKHRLDNFGQQFVDAMAILDSDKPNEKYYHTDLIPVENYSLTASQVLFSAGSSWVFGGMGSWNDLGFETHADNEHYEELSEQLYSKITEAIIAAVNSY